LAQGKERAIPDALSRCPVNKPTAEDLAVGKQIQQCVQFCVIRAVRRIDDDGIDEEEEEVISSPPPYPADPLLEKLKAVAVADKQYSELINAVTTGFLGGREKMSSYVRQYWAIWSDLSVEDGIVLYGRRLVIPAAARSDVLQRLHASHQGIVRTKRRARQTVYWPGVSNEIVLLVEQCQKCQERRPSQQKEPLLSDPLPNRPFEVASANLFQVGRLHALVYVVDYLVGRLFTSGIMIRLRGKCHTPSLHVSLISAYRFDLIRMVARNSTLFSRRRC